MDNNKFTFEIGVLKQEQEPLLKDDSKVCDQRYSLSISTLIILIFAIITLSIFLSNLDRIIKYFNESTSEDSPNIKYDMVIIGGGISGLSNLHFQTMNDKSKKRLLIEKLDRIGGRAISYNINYFNHSIVIEFGAMRAPQNNYYVNRMLRRLNLCHDSIPFTLPGDERIFYYRNTMSNGYTNITIDNYWNNVYQFTDHDLYLLNISTNDLLLNAFNDILLQNNNGNIPNTTEEWYNFRNLWTLNNILVRDYSFKTFYENYLNSSIEFWNYQHATSFHLNSEKSILEELYDRFGPIDIYSNSSLTPGSSQVYTLKNGWNDITWQLFDNVSAYENNDFLLNEKLISIDYNENNNNEYKYIITIENTVNNTIKYIETNDIILAMDAFSIKNNIASFKPIYSKHGLHFIKANVQSPTYKVNMIYAINKTDSEELSFFNKIRSVQGLSTDLSLRNILMDNNSISEDENCILAGIQIYSSLEYRSEILHQLQKIGQHDLYEVDSNINLNDNRNSINNLLISSKLIVQHIQEQLSILTDINIDNIPNPLCAFSQPLGLNDSNIGGLTTWRYGIDHIDAMNSIQKINVNETIYISSADLMFDNGVYHSSGILSAIQILTKYFNGTDPFSDQPTC